MKNEENVENIVKYSIYGLVDPRNKQLRYVGYSKNYKKRFWNHLKESKLKKNTHKNNWIKQLINNNLIPELILIDEFDDKKEALEAEIDYIAYFKHIGFNLTNITPGGEEGAIYERTIEIRNKTSISSKGRKHTEKTKQKISKTLTGVKKTPFSEEHKSKLSKSLIGRKTNRKPTPEHIEKLRKIRLGKKVTEETKQKQVNNNKSYKLTKENIIEIKNIEKNKI